MRKGLKFIFTRVALLLCFLGCERDDLCVDTPVTPFLIITFQNDDRSLDVKRPVVRLQVTLIENNKPFFIEPVSTDSIRIPLNTLKDNTKFLFTRNVGDANEANIASDILDFTYTRKDIYVNRACGFKTLFSDLKVNQETKNWIQNFEILNTNVNDEPNTHIQLFH